MTLSRKFFSATVTLPADTATSLLQLMIASPLHWGYETTALSTPSMDSILGSEVDVTPSGDAYVGSDANVRGVAIGGSTYKGVLIPGGESYSLQDPGPVGLLDPGQVWFYAQSGATMDVTFQAR